MEKSEYSTNNASSDNLLRSDGAPNVDDAEAVDALSTAAARGNLSEVQRLLSLLPECVNQRNKYGRTPLQVVRASRPDVAQLLLEAGADSNVRDRCGGTQEQTPTLVTPLHDMARGGYLATVKCLLRFGADSSLPDAWGNSPAHVAAKHGHVHTLRYLAQGSDIAREKNVHGLTPLDYIRTSTLQRNPAMMAWYSNIKSSPASLKVLCISRVNQTLGTSRLNKRHSLPVSSALRSQLMLQTTSGATYSRAATTGSHKRKRKR